MRTYFEINTILPTNWDFVQQEFEVRPLLANGVEKPSMPVHWLE